MHYGFLLLLWVGFVFSCSTPASREQPFIAQGNELAQDGLLREAAAAYRKAIKVSPNNSTAIRNLGLVQMRLKNYDAAVKNLERVINEFSSDYETNFWLGEGLRASGRYGDAIFRYQRALEIRPKESGARKALAWSYYKVRYYTEALDLTRGMLKENPSDMQTALIQARTLIKIGKERQAMALLDKIKASAAKQDLPYIASVEGDAQLSLNRCSAAVSYYRDALREQPLLPGPLAGMGRCYLEMGKRDQGIEYLERAVRIKPTFADAIYALAKAYETTNFPKSAGYYKRFQKIALRDPEYVDRLKSVATSIAKLENKAKTVNSNSSNENLLSPEQNLPDEMMRNTPANSKKMN